ncbi:M67 family metallopeptidase [Gimibacter soli]|uniref:M67 family metallopeptidase n=1 Tax=Gimibacter soli TaxID=3024400 RepID=A0AAE9XT86_9PROT|nr:M67 family metallopeptidase [Gimibacter soli]WCL53765.1 M67 family metallopeptidase [Gimibacter soli]
MSVTLAPGLLDALEALALEAAPHEACAMLLGTRDHIAGYVPSRNVTDADPARNFEIDPALLLRLHREAREGGPAIAGVWHSHPNGRPEPSDEDRARSVEPGWIWLITAVTGEETVTGCWRADDNDAHRLAAVSYSIETG